MDKNVIFAFLISTAVIIGYYSLFSPQGKKNQLAEQEIATQTELNKIKSTQANPEISPNTAKKKTDSDILSLKTTFKNAKTIEIDSSFYQANISTAGGALESFVLPNYNFSSKPRINIIKTIWNTILGRPTIKREYDPQRKINMVYNPWQKQLSVWNFSLNPEETLFFETNQERINLKRPQNLSLSATSSAGLLIEKTISFDPATYLMNISINIFNPSDKSINIQPSFVVGAGVEPNESHYQARPTRAVVYRDNKLKIYDGGDVAKNNHFSDFDWVGVMNSYFIQAIKKEEDWIANLTTEKSVFNQKEVLVPFLELKAEKNNLLPNERWQNSFEIFIGPKEKEQMRLFSKNLEQSLDLTFDFLGQPMLIALRWFYKFVPNWGVAIIFLTILVRVILFPLTYKGMKSMRKLSLLTPKIQVIRKKHEGNKEKINKEMMEVYKKHKVNPMGGCLPLLLQIPIFIALYSALIPAIELRHSPFIFWITDLSQSDFIYVLPVLMGFSMYLQQKLTPTSATMDATQQKILKWLPVIMTFFFLNFPASLVLYWLTSNIISIAQQRVINKISVVEPQEALVANTSTHAKKVQMLKNQMKQNQKKKPKR